VQLSLALDITRSSTIIYKQISQGDSSMIQCLLGSLNLSWICSGLLSFFFFLFFFSFFSSFLLLFFFSSFFLSSFFEEGGPHLQATPPESPPKARPLASQMGFGQLLYPKRAEQAFAWWVEPLFPSSFPVYLRALRQVEVLAGESRAPLIFEEVRFWKEIPAFLTFFSSSSRNGRVSALHPHNHWWMKEKDFWCEIPSWRELCCQFSSL